MSCPNKPWGLLFLRVLNEIPWHVASRSVYGYHKWGNVLKVILKSRFLRNKSLRGFFFFFKYRPMLLLCLLFEGLWRCPSSERPPSSSAALLQLSSIMSFKAYVAIPQSTAFNSDKLFASPQRKRSAKLFLLLLGTPQHPSAQGESSSPQDPARLGWMWPQLPLDGTCPLLDGTCSWSQQRGEPLLRARFFAPSHGIC